MILDYQNFYFVGIKGVAMTSLAQCLIDAGKNVSGCDVAEDFVTENILQKLNLPIDTNFDHHLAEDIDCLVFTAAHGGRQNPLVTQAQKKKIPILSQAEAMSELFNNKDGVAVCGVGGKSTISAMIAWIMSKNKKQVSFSVGVGNISGLDKTGQWQTNSKYFVAEADEYVIDPQVRPIIPRFSFLTPQITVCSNLKYDHPDVYQDFDQTRETFFQFFRQIKDNGSLIINGEDKQLVELARRVKNTVKVYTIGNKVKDDLQILNVDSKSGKTVANFKIGERLYKLELMIPGEFNAKNALMAVFTCLQMGVKVEDSLKVLAKFSSTKRRFEYLGEKNGVKYYDDYAHHPDEVASAIDAIKSWYPDKKIVVAFQPHTFSRTKALFDSFITSLAKTKNLILLDIFSSAREEKDTTISSKMLGEKIEIIDKHQVTLVKDYKELADYCINSLEPGTIVLTLGAGDIYKFYSLL